MVPLRSGLLSQLEDEIQLVGDDGDGGDEEYSGER